MYAEIAVDIPLFTTLSYEIPEALRGVVRPGQLVQVPFRNRAKTGLVMGVRQELEDASLADKVRPLLDVVDVEPLLTEPGVEFLQFVADYYLAPIGEVVRLALPSAVRLEGIKYYQRRKQVGVPEGLGEDLVEALDLLGDERVAIKTLKEKSSRSDMTYLRLGELERLGLVSAVYEEEVKLRALTEKFYRVAQAPGEGDRIGSKQAEILALFEGLCEGEEALSLAEIRGQVDNPHSSLNGLVDRGFLEMWEEEVYRDPFASEPVTEPLSHEPTAAQLEALASIRRWRERGEFRGFVLHGVTGSGKTEVYVRAIRETMAAGRRALVLLPEIALTPQFVAVFRGYFGETIAVLHSGLSQAEKFDQWRRIRRDEVEIVIGARSAIFAPLDDVGIIIVDEEHDTSFKQEEGPRYNARDMALVRGKLEGAQVILGSATPSLESFYNARERGLLEYLEMPERVAERPMPRVELVDMRGGRQTRGGPSHVLSKTFLRALDDTLDLRQQAILFLNRRGYSPCVLCEDCGHVWKCPNCDVSLTYHRRQEALRCHYCDFSLRLPEVCPECEGREIDQKGVGTEQLESHVHKLYPQVKVGRLDRDTSRGANLRQLIDAFRRRQTDLLIGTQMVTKGHDFPGVTTVGVVLADLGLNFPDFRAAERTFQLMTQVAGRAGRGANPGEVYIQTYAPEHYSLQAATRHDYHTFALRELSIRKDTGYPPFASIVAMKFEATSETAAYQAARDYFLVARRVMRQQPEFAEGVFVLGPALAPLSKLKGKTRWQMLFKSRDRTQLRRMMIALLSQAKYFDQAGDTHRNVRIVVDVDPLNML